MDSRIGTAGVLAVTTYDTFQKLANNINAAKGWHCQLVDARGADATSNIDAITAVSCFKTAGTAVERDNSDTKQFGCGIVDYGYGSEMSKGKQAFLEAAYCNIVHSDNDYDLYIYDCDDVNQSDTLIMQTKAANTGTDYWLPTYGPTGFPILSVEPGHRILVYTLSTGTGDPEALSMMGAIGAVVPVF